MPSAGRDLLQLLQLAPGAFGRGSRLGAARENLPATTIGGSSGPRGIFATENGGQIVANGARTGENNYQIDGVGVTSVSWGGTTVITPERGCDQGNEGHHQQLRRRERPLSRRAGADDFAERHQRSPRQRVFQGQQAGPERLSELQRLRQAPCKRTPSDHNDIGGTVGGPILRDKLFGFFSYETIRRPEPPNRCRAGTRRRNTWARRRRPGSAAETFLTFPGSSPSAGTVLMGAGDSHGCADIGLIEGVNCKFITGRAWTSDGRSIRRSARHTRSVASSVDSRPGLGGDGTSSPANLDGVPDLHWLAAVNPTEEHGDSIQRARRLQRHGEGPARVQHVSGPAEQRFVQRLDA